MGLASRKFEIECQATTQFVNQGGGYDNAGATSMTQVISLAPRKRGTLNSLLQFAIDAHGGFDRWRQLDGVSAHLRSAGVLWSLKRQPGVLDDVYVGAALHREWVSHSPFGEPNLRSSFEPHRVAIETTEGRVVEERFQPRASFDGHGIDTPWDRLQLAYFAGYAMWTYLTSPFLLAVEGVETEEIQPWQEQGETWRCLRVIFPSSIATHSTVQTFYFDSKGLLRRHDYDAEVLGGTAAAHFVYDYKEFSGILVPTKRSVLGRREDGTAIPDPVIVTIDLSEVVFK